MNRRSLARLVGAIRLAPTVDCIGIPVFRAAGMNFDLVPQMDNDLNIVKFIDFYNEEGYSVDYIIPADYARLEYSIANPSPLPIWIAGKLNVIGGDRQPEEVDLLKPDKHYNSAAILALKRTLGDARSGYFHQRAERWKSNQLLSEFSDVLESRPIASRYWVSRYRSAILAAGQGKRVPGAVAERLRRIGSEWLSLFATKTDVGRLKMLMGESDDGVFNDTDRRRSTFAFYLNKYAAGEFRFLEKAARFDPSFLRVFPRGLYYEFLEKGTPRVPFEYRKVPDLLSELRRRIIGERKVEWQRKFDVYAYDQSKYPVEVFMRSSNGLRDARLLALPLFGSSDAPQEIANLLDDMRRARYSDFDSATTRETELRNRYDVLAISRFMDKRGRGYKGFRADDFTYTDSQQQEAIGEIMRVCLQVVSSFDDLRSIDGIAYGDARQKDRTDDYLAKNERYVDEIRRLLPEELDPTNPASRKLEF